METTNNEKTCCSEHKKCYCKGNCHCDAVYGMGLIGSLIYFLQNANGFSGVILGIGKSIV
jgi:hypothetical protein